MTDEEPTDLWVGPRQVRWWNEPTSCTHTNHNVCPGCAELTEDEADAVREYLARLCACTAEYKRPLRITAEGIAVVESGLSLRHAHELKTGCSDDDLCAECRRAIGEG